MTDDAAGPLVVASGRLVVSVDGMLVEVGRLQQAAAVAEGWTGRATTLLDGWTEPPAASWLGDGRAELEDARRTLADLAAEADRLAWFGRLAAAGYAATEETNARLQQLAASAGAWGIGSLFGVSPGPVLFGGGMLGLGAWALNGFDTSRLIASRGFVAFVRNAVDVADDVALAATIRQLTAAAVVAPSAAGLAGFAALLAARSGGRGDAAGNAAAVRGLVGGASGGRLLTDAPVRVHATSTGKDVGAPGGYAELAKRVPSVDGGGPQVRLERYDDGWLVFIGGTADFSPAAGGEPWDLTSDLGLLDGGGSAVERAVAESLERAGYDGEPIVAVGHSAGGMAAARLAQDPAFDVVGGVNLGGAVGGIDTPDGVPFVSVEHVEDLVPALGGNARDDGIDRVTVSRSLFDGAADPDEPFAAHHLAAYRRTAAAMDDSPEPALRELLAAVDGITGGGHGVASKWRADRVAPAD